MPADSADRVERVTQTWPEAAEGACGRVIGFADVKRSIDASENIDEGHDTRDDDAIVNCGKSRWLWGWPKAMSEAACPSTRKSD